LDLNGRIKLKNIPVYSLQKYSYHDYLTDAKKNKAFLAPEELKGIRDYLFQE
jgi:hypothetical protein